MEPKNPNQPQQSTVQIVHSSAANDTPTDIDVLNVIERRNEMLSRILSYAIKSTHSGQWVNQNGKPWPTAAAAEVMARRCAVSIKNVQTNKVPSTDDKGAFYMYVVSATAQLPGGYDFIEAMGTCSSRDQFLGTETQAGRVLSEIDEGNILKAAYSNMLVNAITRLLGVRSLSWEQLESHGISQDGVAKIEYQSGARGGGGTAELTMKFGREKGKPLSQIEDLNWYITKYTEDVANPKDPRYLESNKRTLETLKAEAARRTNAKAGTTSKPTEPSIWDRVQQLCASGGVKDIPKFVKGVTSKDHSSKLTEDDIKKIADALDMLKQEQAGQAL